MHENANEYGYACEHLTYYCYLCLIIFSHKGLRRQNCISKDKNGNTKHCTVQKCRVFGLLR